MTASIGDHVQRWNELPPEEVTPRLQLRGRVFGDLTVLKAVDKRKGSYVWLCRCSCGRLALRLGSYLKYAEARGIQSACSECNVEARRGAWLEHQKRQHEIFTNLFEVSGRLYGVFYDEAEIEYCVEAFEAEGMFFDGTASELPELQPNAVYKAPDGGGQRAAFLIPISGRRWHCDSCVCLMEEGFQCAACSDILCCGCVELEAHHCARASRASWEEDMNRYTFENAEYRGQATKTRQRFVGKVLTREERLARIHSEIAEDLRAKAKRQEQSRKLRAHKKKEAEAKKKQKRIQQWDRRHEHWFTVICPQCFQRHRAQEEPPSVGDLLVCVSCCAVLKFHADRVVRLITHEELEALDPESLHRVRSTQKKVQKYIEAVRRFT